MQRAAGLVAEKITALTGQMPRQRRLLNGQYKHWKWTEVKEDSGLKFFGRLNVGAKGTQVRRH